MRVKRDFGSDNQIIRTTGKGSKVKPQVRCNRLPLVIVSSREYKMQLEQALRRHSSGCTLYHGLLGHIGCTFDRWYYILFTES